MNKSSGIQGLRAIAAGLVVFQHGVFFACQAKGVDFTPYLPIGFGQAGVGIFFVISGFVMTLCLSQGRMFMPQRIARIYPSYWAAVLLSGFLLPLIGRAWHFDSYSLTLLPASTFNESYAVPYWTLVYEMVFYAVIYACIFFRRSRAQIVTILGAWAAVIVLACQSNIHPEFQSDVGAMLAGKWILLSPANLEFIAGAMYGLIGAELLKDANPVSLVIQALILFILAQTLAPMPYYVRYVLWGLSFTLVLHLMRDIQVPRFLERAGDYSYGLYLTHTIFVGVAMYAMVRFIPSAPLFAFFIAAIGSAVAAGLTFGAAEFLFHSAVIKRALRLISSRKLVNAHRDRAGTT
jgi:peptidoglycan/LPS O-acetylase OafA/YrhL